MSGAVTKITKQKQPNPKGKVDSTKKIKTEPPSTTQKQKKEILG